VKIGKVKVDSHLCEEFSSTQVPASTAIAANSSPHIQKQADTLPTLLTQQNELEGNWLLLDGSEVGCQSEFRHSMPLPSMWGIYWAYLLAK